MSPCLSNTRVGIEGPRTLSSLESVSVKEVLRVRSRRSGRTRRSGSGGALVTPRRLTGPERRVSTPEMTT